MKPSMAAAHRRTFMDLLGAGGVAVLRSGRELIRNRDTHFRFRPDSDFWYLTGFAEPDALRRAAAGRRQRALRALRAAARPEQEVWTGRRAGVEGAREQYGVDEAYPIERAASTPAAPAARLRDADLRARATTASSTAS